MSIYFFDSSALSKRYTPEDGTTRVRQITASHLGYLILIAQITPIEITSAFSRKMREGSITVATLNALHRVLQRHIQESYTVVPLIPAIEEEADKLLMRFPLRAMDSIQLASALIVKQHLDQVNPNQIPLTFVSSDDRLTKVAQQVNLSVEFPR